MRGRSSIARQANMRRRLVGSGGRAVAAVGVIGALVLTLGVVSPPQPAQAQSFGEALRNMQRDFDDLFGTPEERRRMIRRSKQRGATQGRHDSRYASTRQSPSYYSAPYAAPTPRPRPSTDEVEAARTRSGSLDVYSASASLGAQPQFRAPVLTAPGVAAAGGAAAVAGVERDNPNLGARRDQAPTSVIAVDPLVALLGPEPKSEARFGAARPAVVAASTAGPDENSTASAVELSKSVAAEARDVAANAEESAAAARTAALSTPVSVERAEAPAPAPTPGLGANVASDPSLRIVLGFLVGAGLLSLAVLREWRVARRAG